MPNSRTLEATIEALNDGLDSLVAGLRVRDKVHAERLAASETP